MKRTAHPDPRRIFSILKSVEGGRRTAEICTKYQIGRQTYYRWKSEYGTLKPKEILRLQLLQEENRVLKKVVLRQQADLEGFLAVKRSQTVIIRPQPSRRYPKK